MFRRLGSYWYILDSYAWFVIVFSQDSYTIFKNCKALKLWYNKNYSFFSLCTIIIWIRENILFRFIGKLFPPYTNLFMKHLLTVQRFSFVQNFHKENALLSQKFPTNTRIIYELIKKKAHYFRFNTSIKVCKHALPTRPNISLKKS